MADLFADQPVPTEEKVAHLRREIAMRRHVYPGLVASRRMTQDKADRGIAVMEAILADYEKTAGG
jgi:hypothetical protein